MDTSNPGFFISEEDAQRILDSLRTLRQITDDLPMYLLAQRVRFMTPEQLTAATAEVHPYGTDL